MKSISIRPIDAERDFDEISKLIGLQDNRPVTEAELRQDYDTHLNQVIRFCVAEAANGQLFGFGWAYRHGWQPGHAGFYLVVKPEQRRQGVGSQIYADLLRAVDQTDIQVLHVDVLDTLLESLLFLEKRGFFIERRRFVSYLDLTSFDETPYLPLIVKLQAEGIRFCSLADFANTADTQQKFYDLNFAVVKDIPGDEENENTYPPFFQKFVLGSPWYKREGQLLAVDGDTWAGLASVYLYPKTVSAYNATTGVIRSHRGRKIAQALKVLAARYAREHGATRIDTNNDSLNTPILAINRKLGYLSQSGRYQLVRHMSQWERPGGSLPR